MQTTLTTLATRTTLSSRSVGELLHQSQNGNLPARHELVGRYRSVIHATAFRMSSNRVDAEDLTEDIYLHVFGVINSCNNTQTLPGWIKRVATEGPPGTRYLLSLREGSRPLQDLMLDSGRTGTDVTFLSGPEGGLGTAEEAPAVAAGFAPVSLGARILRAETASLAALTLMV